MKILVVIPTYNEKENIAKLLPAINDLKRPEIEVLIVDDSSPDGTINVVNGLIKKLSLPIHTLVRKNKEGLGKAYLAGFTWGLDHNYDFICSMDADFSHRPQDLLKLIDAPKDIDVVIGSRYIPGGKIVGWDWKRYVNSKGANIVTRAALGLPNKDVTAGFKRYSRKFLKTLNFNSIISKGYSFQVEMVFKAHQKGFTIFEVPITFVDRTVGESKISGELKKSAAIVWQLFVKREGVRQMIKFGIVGFGNALLDWLVFYILKIPLGQYGQLGKQLAKAGSFLVSGTSSYILNRRWTFRSTDKKVAKQAFKFFIIASIGLLLNNLIFYFVTSPKYLNWPDIPGLVIATGLVTLWNFFMNKYLTFKK